MSGALPMSHPETSVVRLDLKKDERLLVEFADGKTATFPVRQLRARCPCAGCRTMREQQASRPKRSLTVLGANLHEGPIVVVSAELVGNYALRIDWNDGHGSGIYSFAYLREIADAPVT